MTTLIKADYTKFKEIIGEEETKIPDFYCRENPLEALKILALKYPVTGYKNLYAESPGILLGEESKIFFKGLIIKDVDKNIYLPMLGSVKNYDLEVPSSKYFMGRYREILESFARNYLIEIKTIDPGSATIDYDHRVIGSRSAKQEAINYLKERKNNPNPEKEKNLEAILEYGNAVIGPEFKLRSLEKMTKKIAKNIPKKTQPKSFFFATLRPSNFIRNTMFPKGPLIR